jgi:hypothetical protein
MNTTMPDPPRSRIHVLLTVLGLAGIAVPFLPFTMGIFSDVSPLDAVKRYGVFMLLGMPFFLCIFISAASIRWLIWGLFSRAERAIAYLASAAMACLTLSFLLEVIVEDGLAKIAHEWDAHEWLAFAAPLLIIIIGVFALLKGFRKCASKQFSVLLALQVAYLANCAFCLVGFYPDWLIGAYCSLLTAAVYVLQIALVLGQRPPVADGGQARNG